MSYINYTGKNYQMTQGAHAENNTDGVFTDQDKINYNIDKVLNIKPRGVVLQGPPPAADDTTGDLQAKKRGMDFSETPKGKRIAERAEKATTTGGSRTPSDTMEQMNKIYGSIYNAGMAHLKK